MFCPNCGKEVEAGQKFCPYCGTPMPTVNASNPLQNENVADRESIPNVQPKPKKKKHRGLIAILVIAVVAVVIGVFAFGNNSNHTYELTNFLNMDEDEFLKITNYKKTDSGYYPSDDTIVYQVEYGKVISVMLSESVMKEDDSYKVLYIAGLQPGMKFTSEDMKGLKDFKKINTVEGSGDYTEIFYTDKAEDCMLGVSIDPDTKKITNIYDMVSSKDDIEEMLSGVDNSDSSQSTDESDSQGVSDSDTSSDTSDSTDTDTDTTDESTQDQNSDEFIFPDSDSVVEDGGDIEQLSDEDLRIAINEIYARHGYHFKSAALQDYFSNTSRYVDEGITDQSEILSELNKYEKENLDNLIAERNARK